MAQKKKSHRTKPAGKPKGASYSDMLALKRAQMRAFVEAAESDAARVQGEIYSQRMLWLSVVSISKAYNFGPKRMNDFFTALQESSDEFDRMSDDVDDEYALDKLRQKAEAVTGVKIKYLYEEEMREKRRLFEVVEEGGGEAEDG